MIQPSPQCNGYRDRDWERRAGTVELRTAEAEEGSAGLLLEPRRMAEKALTAANRKPMSKTSRVRSVLKAMGMSDLSKSQVSWLSGRRPALIPYGEFR